MTTKQAQKIREAAAGLLLEQRLRSLFIDVRKLQLPWPVLFSSYGDFCRETKMTIAQIDAGGRMPDGCAILHGHGGEERYIILYNEKQGSRRRNFTLAHEIGHICLGHKDDGEKWEAEANAFAAELLMPLALVREMERRVGRLPLPEELCTVFNLSIKAASLAVSHMGEGHAKESKYERHLVQRFGGLLPVQDGPMVDW